MKNTYTKKQIKELMKNKYIKNVTKNSIYFTDEFKKYFLMRKNENIKTEDIFLEIGIDKTILSIDKMRACDYRWSKEEKFKVVENKEVRKNNKIYYSIINFFKGGKNDK